MGSYAKPEEAAVVAARALLEYNDDPIKFITAIDKKKQPRMPRAMKRQR